MRIEEETERVQKSQEGEAYLHSRPTIKSDPCSSTLPLHSIKWMAMNRGTRGRNEVRKHLSYRNR